MGETPGPEHLSRALSQLIATRGLARVRGPSQLQEIWLQAAGASIGRQTRVLAVRRGVLHVGVGNAPLLGELASFHKPSLLRTIQQRHPELKIRDLKFQLRRHSDEA